MNQNAPPSHDLDRVLGEIATEFFERLSKGESPKIEEYVERHPGMAEMIRLAFPASVSLLNRLFQTCGEIILITGAHPQTEALFHQQISDWQLLQNELLRPALLKEHLA